MYKGWISCMILIFSFYEGASIETACTARGRFPNNEAPDCRGYTMCLLSAGGYAKFDLLCPENSTYSHIDNQCTNVTSYHCLPDYNCTQEGNFVNLLSKNCTSYVACVKDLRNFTTARLISCHANEIFSNTDMKCVNESLYTCYVNTESPIVLEVSVNQFPGPSGNFSLNSKAFVNTLSIKTIPLIALVILSLKHIL